MSYLVMYPIPMSSEPERCPQCREIQDIKQVCRHCGYEYPEEHTPWWHTLLIVIGIVVGGWLVLTILFWLMQAGDYDAFTLWELIRGQWDCVAEHLDKAKFS